MENVSIEWVQDECSDLLMTIEELESAGILAESIHVDQSSLIANMNLVEIARVQASARLARASAQAALARQESRGCHRRSDLALSLNDANPLFDHTRSPAN